MFTSWQIYFVEAMGYEIMAESRQMILVCSSIGNTLHDILQEERGAYCNL